MKVVASISQVKIQGNFIQRLLGRHRTAYQLCVATCSSRGVHIGHPFITDDKSKVIEHLQGRLRSLSIPISNIYLIGEEIIQVVGVKAFMYDKIHWIASGSEDVVDRVLTFAETLSSKPTNKKTLDKINDIRDLVRSSIAKTVSLIFQDEVKNNELGISVCMSEGRYGSLMEFIDNPDTLSLYADSLVDSFAQPFIEKELNS